MADSTEQACLEIKAELARVAAECRRIESLWWRCRLEAAEVPAHRGDGLLVEQFDRYTKRGAMTTLFGKITSVERVGNSLLVAATARAAGAVASALRGALRKAVDLTLGQMHNPDAASAGRVLSATVDSDGVVTIRALINDRPAVHKTRARVYPGISISYRESGGQCEIDEIALVDRDFSKAAGAGHVLAKIYEKDAGIPMQRAPQKRGEDEAAKQWAKDLLNRAIVPDSSDAQKRSQALADWCALYRAGRRQIVGDPRFTNR